jgi:transcriptional regulator with XRE-family HTH domain|tara:strand:- start:92 stop:496 length:405 start_codon:yes stop_codon:yes gene_type:complete
MKVKLLEEDGNQIKGLLREMGKTQAELAPLLGFKRQQSVSLALSGRLRLNQGQLKTIYNFLGEDESLSYLLNYSEGRLDSTQNFSDIDKVWIKVYNSYSHKLRDVCLSLPLEKKGVLLGDLEKLASKYSQKSQE